MKPHSAAYRLIAFCISLVLASSVAQAQTNQGQIAGNVLDPSGAVVPNASIVAKGEANGVVYNATSTSAGSYRFASIQLGRYTITTSAPGFKQTVNTGVEVRVNTTTAFDITLSAGGGNETVTVESNAPTIQTQSSEVGGTVTERQIVELPLALGGVGAMRSPEAFVFLIPGTTGPGSANNNNGIFINKIGGGQNFGSEILLDGASQTRSENGSSFDEEAPSVEAITEFKVTTNAPTAEFGRTTGGIINFVTKSGTNAFHGTAFELFRNDALNANSWFNNGFKAILQARGNATEANFNRPSDKKNDFGGTFGGPVAIPHIYNGHDKSFFFFAWEQYRQKLGGVTTSTVPTALERSGDFSERLNQANSFTGQINPCDGSRIRTNQIFDPATTRTVNGTQCRTAFLNNKIPSGRFNQTAQKIVALYPAPTSGALLSNYSLNSSSAVTNTTYTIRVDHSIGANDKIYGSYSSRENTRNSPTNFTFLGPQDPSTQVQDFITHFGRAGWDHVFTPSLLNHLNLGFNRSNSINGSIQALSGVNYAQQLGIPNIPTGLPRFDVDGYQSLSRNQNDDLIDNGIRVNDSVSWQKGRNSFKIGLDYRYQQFSAISNGQTNGLFHFANGQTGASFDPTISTGSGNGFASLLLGGYNNATVSVPAHQARWISQYFAGFIQDDFKASKSLVLNIGLRYDVDQPRKEAQNFTSNFSPTAIDPKAGIPGALVFASNCGNCNKRWADTYYKDIGPRVGFAYTPESWNSKLVIRGAYGMLYAPLQYSDFGGDMRTGYTVPVNVTSNGFDPALTIDQGVPAFNVAVNLDPGIFDNNNSAAPVTFGNFIKPSYGRPGVVNQWNLQVQQELAKDLILTLGYTASSGAHLKSQAENINNISKSNFGLGDVLTRTFAVSAPATGKTLPYPKFNTAAQYQHALRPFPQYGFIATDCCLQNVGHSSYEALIASVERRLSQGLTLQASYTWSKTITNADSLINVTNGVQQEQDPFNSKSQKSLSNQDIPHTFVVSFLYQLPFGKNKMFLNHSTLLDEVVGGWKLGGVLRYQSGEPISFGCAAGIPGWDNCINYTRIPGSSLASNARRGKLNPFRNFIANGTVAGPDPNVDSEFNGLLQPAGVNGGYAALQNSPALIDQNLPANRLTRAVQRGTCATCDNGAFLFGNVPRVTGELRNYRYYNEDLSFLKDTNIHEGVLFTFKVELLNAFNRHAFQTPDTQPNDALYGVPTATLNGPRSMQLTARIQF